jgi:hypothetical protein
MKLWANTLPVASRCCYPRRTCRCDPRCRASSGGVSIAPSRPPAHPGPGVSFSCRAWCG